MRKSILSFLSFALIVAIISSCSTSSDLTSSSVIKKRRYLKGYQVDIKGSQKADERSKTATAQLEPLKTKDLEHKQTGELAQASVSNKITDADLKSPSVFEAPIQAEKNVIQKDNAKTNFNPENQRRKRAKNSYSRKMLKNTLATPMAQSASDADMVLYIILAIILPPLAVGLLYGIGTEFLISLVLTLLFWIPGVIYALIMVLRKG